MPFTAQVQALLGAQEAAKRQCIDGFAVPQEQQPPTGDFQQQDGTDQTYVFSVTLFADRLQHTSLVLLVETS